MKCVKLCSNSHVNTRDLFVMYVYSFGGAENAGVENAGVDRTGGKSGSGKFGSENVWKTVRTENKNLHQLIITDSMFSKNY